MTMPLAVLKETLWRRGHAPEVPADRIESAGRVPRGLRLLPGFVTEAGQEEIAAWIATHVSWSVGTSFGNRRETFMPGRKPLPEWGEAIGLRMLEAGFFEAAPNQLYLIQYHAGSGIPFHIDLEEHGEAIAGLT
jgi:hypothetical protein